jgi:hypothetical protein
MRGSCSSDMALKHSIEPREIKEDIERFEMFSTA